MGKITTRGIDVYDLDTHEKVDSIQFPSHRTGEPRETDISTLRFTPGYRYLLVDNPLTRDTRETDEEKEKNSLIINAESREVKKFGDFPLSVLHVLSPSGKFVYGFHSFNIGPSKGVYSIQKEELVSFVEGKEELIEAGGWQPDPEGKYEDKPYTLDYPEMWGSSPVRFYDRGTLKQIGKLSEKNIGGAASLRQPDAINKTQRYTVGWTIEKPEGKDGPRVPNLHVVDMKKMKVVNSFPLEVPDNFYSMTYIDVN